MIKEMQRTSQNRKALLMFLSGITILPFGPEAAQAYGEIRHTLQSQGQLIGANDLLVAAHAKTAGLILNTQYKRILQAIIFYCLIIFYKQKFISNFRYFRHEGHSKEGCRNTYRSPGPENRTGPGVISHLI